MNLQYLKYAVEVASRGSINKAAEALYMDQSNISRCIKDLESSLGISIFERSSRGIKVTPKGEEFLKYAKNVLAQVDAIENMFLNDAAEKTRFSVSAPRAGYVCDAFTTFASALPESEAAETVYTETDAQNTVKNVLEANYGLGIVRYAERYDKYYKAMLADKGLACELIAEFRYELLTSAKSDLAEKDDVTFADLKEKTEIATAELVASPFSLTDAAKDDFPQTDRRVCVYERASLYELLDKNPDSFAWSSPLPAKTLERYGLVMKKCAENKKVYKDLLVYKKDYEFTESDKAFITELCRTKREIFKK